MEMILLVVRTRDRRLRLPQHGNDDGGGWLGGGLGVGLGPPHHSYHHHYRRARYSSDDRLGRLRLPIIVIWREPP